MFKVEGDLYPHREHWPKNDRQFFHVLQGDADDDPKLVPIKSIKDWLEEANLSYTTEWEQKGRKFIVFQRRVDAIRFALAWL